MTDEATHPCTLRFDGALTIREIEGLHARLVAALRDHAAITVDASDASEVDLAFVQLVIAARRSARAQGTAFALAAPAGGPLLETLLRGGLLAAECAAECATGHATGRVDDRAARSDGFWMKGSETP